MQRVWAILGCQLHSHTLTYYYIPLWWVLPKVLNHVQNISKKEKFKKKLKTMGEGKRQLESKHITNDQKQRIMDSLGILRDVE